MQYWPKKRSDFSSLSKLHAAALCGMEHGDSSVVVMLVGYQCCCSTHVQTQIRTHTQSCLASYLSDERDRVTSTTGDACPDLNESAF